MKEEKKFLPSYDSYGEFVRTPKFETTTSLYPRSSAGVAERIVVVILIRQVRLGLVDHKFRRNEIMNDL